MYGFVFVPDCTIHFINVLNTERVKRARKKIYSSNNSKGHCTCIIFHLSKCNALQLKFNANSLGPMSIFFCIILNDASKLLATSNLKPEIQLHVFVNLICKKKKNVFFFFFFFFFVFFFCFFFQN